jgi:hypothetical protein
VAAGEHAALGRLALGRQPLHLGRAPHALDDSSTAVRRSAS